MKKYSSGCLCPIRDGDKGIETLLTKRCFWNHLKGRPMRFPGEWVFSGGKKDTTDIDLKATAIREFHEEMGYQGNILVPKMYHKEFGKDQNDSLTIEFYSCKIENCDFNPSNEVIEYKWTGLQEAIDLILDPGLTKELESAYVAMDFNDKKYDLFSIEKRKIPKMNLRALEKLIDIY